MEAEEWDAEATTLVPNDDATADRSVGLWN